MAAGKSDVPDTMIEGLQQLLPDIAVCQAAPDADIPFLDKLQKIVLLRIHQPSGQKPPGGNGPGGPGPAGAMGSPPPPGAAGPGAPGSAGGGAPNPSMASQAAPAPPTQPGGVSKPMTPDPDEMRRVLAQQAGS